MVHDLNQYMVKRSTNLLYHPMCLITILAAAVLEIQITAQEHAYKSQHETILADLNWYTADIALINNYNR